MSLLPAEVIRRKRDGAELSGEEVAFLVDGITHGGLSDARSARSRWRCSCAAWLPRSASR